MTSTRTDDEVDQYHESEEEVDRRGLGYEEPPNYDEHVDHQRMSRLVTADRFLQQS